MIRRPPRSTHCISSAASDVYKRQELGKGADDGNLSNTFRRQTYLSPDKKEAKENESPIFLCSQTESNELMSSLTTEELFKDYTKQISMKDLNENYTTTKRSHITCLRYIKFDELLQEFEKSANKHGRISQKAFISTISNMVTKANKLSGRLIKQRLERVYELLKESKEAELSLKELAGLSVMCKGQAKTKIRAALHYMGANSNKLTFNLILRFVCGVFRLLLQENVNFAVNVDIGSEEFGKMTAMQCFDDCNAPYDSCITIDNFTSWFSSQVKTLVPKCKKLKANCEASGEKACFLETLKIDSELIMNSIDSDGSSEFKFDSPNPRANESKGMPSTCYRKGQVNDALVGISADPQDMKSQWNYFLNHYYATYGFYPPPPLFQLSENGYTMKVSAENSDSRKTKFTPSTRHNRTRSNYISAYNAV
eukprot:TRINITY_DN12895_c0_g1_i3.p1 TRINITY_DN12895_c0_g1~~TRINITY_DN12895_c0_g1_i3.p1  ORF type:complete len:432 (+),score=92.01 TRINITY_DN12895_c0_g1_i3:24-1298(+)